MRKINILTKADLSPLINSLITELTIVEANRAIYERLTELCGKGKECEIVFLRSNTFWTLMIKNISDQIIAGLARLYDVSPKTFCLQTFIKDCKDNKQIFPGICKLPQWNDYEEQSEAPASVVLRKMQEEYNRVETERGKIKNIRNKVMSHIDRAYVLDSSSLYSGITWAEIENLIEAAQNIINYVLVAAYDTAASFLLVDYDDIDRLLKMALYGYNRKKAEHFELYNHMDNAN